HLPPHRLDLVVLREVRDELRGAAAGLLDAFAHGGQGLRVSPMQGELGPGRGERPCDRRADPPRAARHQCRLALHGDVPLRASGRPSAVKEIADERRAQVDVDLDESALANALEAVTLARFDDQNVPGAGLEFLALDDVPCPPFADELDLVIWMPM